MKKTNSLLLTLVTTVIVHAQTNTFPSSGNAGVGTTSPGLLNGSVDKLLDIEGANSAGVSVRATNTGGREYLWYSDSGGLLNLYDATANALRVTVNASGNVGIGTTTPQAKLSFGTSLANTKLALYDDTVGPTIYGFGIQPNQFRIHLDQTASRFSFLSAPAGTELFTIKGTGNVGVGTASPGSKLSVQINTIGDGVGLYGFSGGTLSPALVYYIDGIYRGSMGLATSPGHFSVPATPGDLVLRAVGNTGNVLIANQQNGDINFATGINGSSDTLKLVIKNSGNVGIGTTSPANKLDVAGSIGSSGNVYLTGANSQIGFTRNDGAQNVGGVGWHTDGFYYLGGHPSYGIVAGSEVRVRGFGSYLRLGTAGVDVINISPSGNVGIGTTNPTQKLSVNGTIRAQGVIVEASPWPDYVFSEGYALAPLSEVEQRIKAEKHLPGIPSEQEVVEHGVNLGEMQSKILAKVEELTLYMIELKKENRELSKELSALRQAALK